MRTIDLNGMEDTLFHDESSYHDDDIDGVEMNENEEEKDLEFSDEGFFTADTHTSKTFAFKNGPSVAHSHTRNAGKGTYAAATQTAVAVTSKGPDAGARGGGDYEEI